MHNRLKESRVESPPGTDFNLGDSRKIPEVNTNQLEMQEENRIYLQGKIHSNCTFTGLTHH